MNLQDAGLLKLKDKKAHNYFDWQWQKIQDSLGLLNEENNPQSPTDISYVYNGYSPISVKLIEHLVEMQGIQPLKDKGFLSKLNLTDDKVYIPPQE